MNTVERGSLLFEYELRGRKLYPQQFEIGECLDRLRPLSAIVMSRRSAKTESVLLWVFAMMQERPGLQVAFTMATTREAARAKFMADVWPIMDELADIHDDVKVYRGQGFEGAHMGGSSFVVVAPNDKAFRSKAFDIIIVDESGAAEPDVVEHLMPALLPTLDTSDLGMLILMGTAGDYRAGNLLWDALHDDDAAVVDYSPGDVIDVAALADWDYAEAMLEMYHPGIGTLTTSERIKRNWALMTPKAFAQEYLSVWGNAGGDGGLFNSDQWTAGLLLEKLPTPPKRFALGVAASDDSAAIVAAWRDEHGQARIVQLDGRAGRAWLPSAARDLARRYRVPVVLDPRSNTIMADVKQALEQLRPAPRLEVQDYESVAAAHERMKLEVERGTVSHYGQQSLTDAFLAVKRVQMGAKWKFASMKEGIDITPAQAATLALRYYDSQPRAVRSVIEAVAV
jgi:hypothetical protein